MIKEIKIDDKFEQWDSLERFSIVISDKIKPDEFMYMGSLQTDAIIGDIKPIVHLYKHRFTRRYLNLDASLNCFKYVHTPYREAYDVIGRNQAIEYVLS